MPIPKTLPMIILKRAPSNKELFGTNDVETEYNKQQKMKQAQMQSTSRPPLVSKGFNNRNFNQFGSHQQHMPPQSNHHMMGMRKNRSMESEEDDDVKKTKPQIPQMNNDLHSFQKN